MKEDKSDRLLIVAGILALFLVAAGFGGMIYFGAKAAQAFSEQESNVGNKEIRK